MREPDHFRLHAWLWPTTIPLLPTSYDSRNKNVKYFFYGLIVKCVESSGSFVNEVPSSTDFKTILCTRSFIASWDGLSKNSRGLRTVCPDGV
jgi:hypothetical protein